MTTPAAAPPDTAALRARVQASLARQGMMQHLGVRLLEVAPGQVTLALPYGDRVTQQQGGFHGGAMGALADIAGGYAGLTVAPEGMEVTTVEFKINFLAAFQNGELHATGRVVRAGRRLIVTTAEVVHVAPDGRRSACAVMQQTLAPVPQTY
ncbi:PaaI family thioesterase [Aquabacterium sp. A08]|uniref:PaaI family thioesterase n=1 Tax=Aquabacterium sp. A08 TaxID=2718532 RepID=UPI0014207AEF|nr:PaaI family thioesterase [Aquabacterium sp. A08]NIC41172.1 PaaI family thioesterase [Aquabacterium sp. A08]